MFEDLWNHRLANTAEQEKALKTELEKTQRSVEQFLDRIAVAQLPSVITAYENRIRKLEAQKLDLNEKIANCGRPLRSFDETLRTSLGFLANPLKSGFQSVWKTKERSSNWPLPNVSPIRDMKDLELPIWPCPSRC
jgi:hypothetical protein